MSELYTDEDVQAAAEAGFRVRWLDLSRDEQDRRWASIAEESPGYLRHLLDEARAELDAVAPAIAARALRELIEDADGNARLPVLDGGSSYIDLIRRADEIERSKS